MQDSWLTHNTDKILLFVLTLILVGVTVHVMHHDAGDMQAFGWASGAFSTVLGALVMILTGRVQRADGQTANGVPPGAQPNAPAPTLTPALPPATRAAAYFDPQRPKA